MFPHVDLINNNQELAYRINCSKALSAETVVFHCVHNSTNSEQGRNQKIKTDI